MDKDKKTIQTMSIENDRVYNRILLLVNQTMEAFNNAKEAYGGDDMCLLTNEGELYGLTGQIKLGKNGYLYIPLRGALGQYSSLTPMKCKVFTKSNGKCVLYNDWYEESWNDARKALNKIIKDADRACKHMEGWNPNWEDLEGKEKRDTINRFNKSAGFKKGTFVETVEREYTPEECIRLADMYMAIERQIMNGRCAVKWSNGESFHLSGRINNGSVEWYTDDIVVNQNNGNTPSIDSEHASIYLSGTGINGGDGEFHLQDIDIYDYSNESDFGSIWEYCEQKYGHEPETLINMIGGGGVLPDYILDSKENGIYEGVEHKYPMPSENAMIYLSNPDGTCVAEITIDSIDSTDFTLHNYETGETIEHFLPGDATYEQMEAKMRELFPDALQESYGYDEDNDDDDVTGTVDYVIDSVINGNDAQAAREAAKVMSKGHIKDLLTAARETGDQNLEEKIWNAISWGLAYI